MADAEQEDVAACGREPVERAADRGRADALMTVQEIGGSLADRSQRVGRVERPDGAGPPAEDLGEQAGARREIGSERLVVVREGRHDDETARADRPQQGVDQLVRVETDCAEGRVDDDPVAWAERDHSPSSRARVAPRIASLISVAYGASVTRASSIAGSPKGASVEKKTRPPRPSGSAAASAVGHST